MVKATKRKRRKDKDDDELAAQIAEVAEVSKYIREASGDSTDCFLKRVMQMIHRHIDDELDLSVPAIEDVILRGSFEDQRRLARRIACDPFGETAQALECILNAIPEELGSYGIVWARFLERARARDRNKKHKETSKIS